MSSTKGLYWILLLVLIYQCNIAQGRVDSRSKYLPACYTVVNGGNDICHHPSYTKCYYPNETLKLCCGQDHYCCNNNRSCCRRETWNGYEMTGVVTGILSWVGILIVTSIYAGIPIFKIAKQKWKKLNKISPKSEMSIEMKQKATGHNINK